MSELPDLPRAPVASFAVQADAASQAVFAAARDGVLMIQRCERCGLTQFALAGLSAAVGRCRHCGAADPPWVPARGTGTLVSWTAVPSPTAVAVAGIVALSEGPWIFAALDLPPADLRPSMQLVAGFAPSPDGGEPVPVFRAAGA